MELFMVYRSKFKIFKIIRIKDIINGNKYIRRESSLHILVKCLLNIKKM